MHNRELKTGTLLGIMRSASLSRDPLQELLKERADDAIPDVRVCLPAAWGDGVASDQRVWW